MLFVYDIGDVIGLTALVIALAGFGYLKAASALRVRRARRRA